MNIKNALAGIDSSVGQETFYPDNEQKEIERWAKIIDDVLNENSIEKSRIIRFGLFWKCRKGKTPGLLNIFNLSSADVLFVFSRAANVSDEWLGNVKKFQNFKMFAYELWRFVEKKVIYKSGKFVLAETIQWLEKQLGMEDYEDLSEELQTPYIQELENRLRIWIRENLTPLLGNCKIMVANDEAHSGFTARVTKTIIRVLCDELNVKLIFDLSGTGEKLYAANEYDYVASHSLIEEINCRNSMMLKYKLKLNDTESQWIEVLKTIDFSKDADARKLIVPVYVAYLAKISEMVDKEKILTEYPPFMQILDRERVDNFYIVESILLWILGLGKFKDPTSQFFNKSFINQGNVTDYIRFAHMFFVDRVEHGRYIQYVLENIAPFKGLVSVINICGNEDKIRNIDELNKTIEDELASGRFVIVLSAQMYGQGSTINMVRFIHHLSDGHSYTRQFQNGTRGQSPVFGDYIVNGDFKPIFKKNTIDVYYNLAQFFEVAWQSFDLKNHIARDESGKTLLIRGDLTNYMQMMGFDMTEIDLQDLFNWVKNSETICKSLGRIISNLNLEGIRNNIDVIRDVLKDKLKSKRTIKELRKKLGDEEVKNTDKRARASSDNDTENDPNKDIDMILVLITVFLKQVLDFSKNDTVYNIKCLKELENISDDDFETIFSLDKELLYILTENRLVDIIFFDEQIKMNGTILFEGI